MLFCSRCILCDAFFGFQEMEANDADVNENQEAPCQVFKELNIFEFFFFLMGIGLCCLSLFIFHL